MNAVNKGANIMILVAMSMHCKPFESVCVIFRAAVQNVSLRQNRISRKKTVIILLHFHSTHSKSNSLLFGHDKKDIHRYHAHCISFTMCTALL